LKAVAFAEHGGPEVLVLRSDLPDPVAAHGHVVVDVRACSVNFLDVWTRRGLPYAIEMPPVCGNDLFGLRKQGGYAERVAAPARNCFPKPESLSFEEAASMPLVFLTAWHMLVGRVGLRPGETVLVLAAGSGVGIAAVQIARMLGATVIATASSEAKLEKARGLGAEHAIDYTRDDFAAEARRITGKRGVDVVFEHTGADTWEQSIAALARGGRLVTCGATSGFDGQTDLRALFAKHLSILGSYMGRLAEFDEVMKHIRSGRLRPVLDRVLPLGEARAAHEAMERREQFGKIVLVP
jgi:NADPH:quinone reductase-like Zn-dependent oxidoreductase